MRKKIKRGKEKKRKEKTTTKNIYKKSRTNTINLLHHVYRLDGNYVQREIDKLGEMRLIHMIK